MQGSDVTTAPGAFADVAALRACWHPVAFGHDVAGRPVHADLLGEPLVLWRGPDGGPRANSDLCVHRGTALSLGWITGDELVCPYHGWRYRADGRCAAIPQLEDPSRVPAKARIGAFGCQERYGLIWVALAEPRWPLPEVPELEDGGWTVVTAGPYRWRCDAARQVENFTDFGHFPWVHPGLLGDPNGQWCPGTRSAPRETFCTIQSSGRRPQPRRLPGVRKRAGGAAGTPQPLRAAPAVHDRAASRLGRRARHGVLLRLPAVRRRQLRRVCAHRPQLQPRPARAGLQEFEDTIFGQDQVVVESQRPERVPFDLAAELHLKFDAVAVAYRKAMRRLGLATSDAIGQPAGSARMSR